MKIIIKIHFLNFTIIAAEMDKDGTFNKKKMASLDKQPRAKKAKTESEKAFANDDEDDSDEDDNVRYTYE